MTKRRPIKQLDAVCFMRKNKRKNKMPDINFKFTAEDEFSEILDKMDNDLERSAGLASRSERSIMSFSSSVSSAAKKIGGLDLGSVIEPLFNGVTSFLRLEEPIKQALDEVAEKQRTLILLGNEAGSAFNEFSHKIANSMGRAEQEVRRAGLRFREIGLGGKNIKELTELADRFANLNPSRGFSDVAETFADAVKSKSSGGLADLLGGGEGVELKLQRSGIDRMLRSGNVSGAMEKFKQVADSFGYTQKKADELGMTIDRKIEKITNIGKNYVISAISDAVKFVEPYITKVLNWLESEDVQQFFEDVRVNLGMAAAAVSAFVNTVIEGWQNIYDFIEPVITSISEGISGFFESIGADSLSLVDKLIVIFVGGVTQIVTGVIELVQRLWNGIVELNEKGDNFLTDIIEGGLNFWIKLIDGARKKILGLVEGLVNNVIDLLNKVAKTDLGDFLGINKAIEGLQVAADKIKDIKNENLKPISFERIDYQKKRVNVIDSVQITADMIGSALDKVHGLYESTIPKEGRRFDEILKTLFDLKDDTGKLVGLQQKEQDLRWMKEMAEQKFINEINLRQLTPTINLQVKGTSNQTPNQYAKSLAIELQKMADAGTFNAYGNVG
jgi:hypothetical protein